jgi:hypothetical protein
MVATAQNTVKCIFTIDYEIYGNGEGSLTELVYEPSRKLKSLFDQSGVKMVNFVEAAELEKISEAGSDPAIHLVEEQIREFYRDGHEIALHLHPQWYNASYANGRWSLDYSEYNLCVLKRERIVEIVRRAIAYLRRVLGDNTFNPVSFRAGNWLFQPTSVAAEVLAAHGLRIDSSVFKGGIQHKHKLDYRPAAANGAYWRFTTDVNRADARGAMVEVPIFTRMVRPWKMANKKRMQIQRKGASSPRSAADKLWRLWDLARLEYPLKFDFCRMTLDEMEVVLDAAQAELAKGGDSLYPLVAIGHSKDLVDFEPIEAFLNLLKKRQVAVCTLEDFYAGLAPDHRPKRADFPQPSLTR